MFQRLVLMSASKQKTLGARAHIRTYQTRFGPVTMRRLRGWCRRCRAWRFPADQALGSGEAGSVRYRPVGWPINCQGTLNLLASRAARAFTPKVSVA